MQVLGGVIGYYSFREVAAECGVGSRVLATDELLDSKPVPFCFVKKLIHISVSAMADVPALDHVSSGAHLPSGVVMECGR